MSFTRKNKTTYYDYHIRGIVLVKPDVICDLGVSFDPKLSFNYHVNQIVGSAYKTLGPDLQKAKLKLIRD